MSSHCSNPSVSVRENLNIGALHIMVIFSPVLERCYLRQNKRE